MAPCRVTKQRGRKKTQARKEKEQRIRRRARLKQEIRAAWHRYRETHHFSVTPKRSWTQRVWGGRVTAGGKMCCKTPHLEFPPGVEFLQALHGLLPVHHGGYGGPLLQEEGEMVDGLAEV